MSRILLIDDMSAVRRAISAVLRNGGYDVVEADNGQNGIELSLNERFDLVITDIMMPVSDGVDVIDSLKKTPGAPPVIAMSGGGAGIPADAALAIPKHTADATLVKPFENDELLKTVSGLL